MTAAATIVERLDGGDYYKPAHQHIHNAIRSILAAGSHVDVITVSDELRRAGLLDEVGGMEYLAELQNATPAISAVGNYAKIVRDTSRSRRLLYVAADLVEAAYQQDLDAASAKIPELEAITSNATTTGVRDRPLHFEHPPAKYERRPLDWWIQGLWLRHTHGELGGAEKTLKTTLALTMHVGAIAGLPILGRWQPPATPEPISVLVGEGGRAAFLSLLDRVCRSYGVTMADVCDLLRFTTVTAPANSTKFLRDLHAELDHARPGLVHLDPWYAFSPSNTDARNLYENGPVLEQIGALTRDAGAGLILSNHFNRSATGNGLRQISMAGHAEWCDSWLLVKHRETPDVPAGRFRLRLDTGSRQWGGAAYDIDLNLGRYDHDLGDFDEPMTWYVTTAATAGEPSSDTTTGAREIDEHKSRLVKWWTSRKSSDPVSKEDWCNGAKALHGGDRTKYREAFRILSEPDETGRSRIEESSWSDKCGRQKQGGRYVLNLAPFEQETLL
jgi:hypothetical protein